MNDELKQRVLSEIRPVTSVKASMISGHEKIKSQIEPVGRKESKFKKKGRERFKRERYFEDFIFKQGIFKKHEAPKIPDAVRVKDGKFFEIKYPVREGDAERYRILSREFYQIVGQVLIYQKLYGDCGLILPKEVEDYVKNNVEGEILKENKIEVVYL